jgi:hypothetical protein
MYPSAVALQMTRAFREGVEVGGRICATRHPPSVALSGIKKTAGFAGAVVCISPRLGLGCVDSKSNSEPAIVRDAVEQADAEDKEECEQAEELFHSVLIACEWRGG